MQKLFLVTAILVILFMSNAYAKEVPFTQEKIKNQKNQGHFPYFSEKKQEKKQGQLPFN